MKSHDEEDPPAVWEPSNVDQRIGFLLDIPSLKTKIQLNIIKICEIWTLN